VCTKKGYDSEKIKVLARSKEEALRKIKRIYGECRVSNLKDVSTVLDYHLIESGGPGGFNSMVNYFLHLGYSLHGAPFSAEVGTFNSEFGKQGSRHILCQAMYYSGK
jgi:hypothetical protein